MRNIYILIVILFASCQPYRYVIRDADIVITKNRARIVKLDSMVVLPTDTILHFPVIYKKPVKLKH